MFHALLLGCAFGTLCGQAVAADPPIWNQFGGPTGDFRTSTALPNSLPPSAIVWRTPLGLGESSIIGDGKRLYTMAGSSDAEDKTKGTEVIVALDPKDGKVIWEHKYEVTGLPKGETPVKGGRCGPQATPCVGEGRVFAIGYSGRVSALDAATGKLLWEKNLIADFGAVSPEFGFASSPILCGEILVIPAGGKKAALVALDPSDGTEKWRSPAERASCCTPQLATLCGVKQIVHMTRSQLNGYSPVDGTVLWSMPLAVEGQTNVPSPLVLPGDRILISGQGVKGMRLVSLTREGDKFAVKEQWKADPQFFYCNWGVANETLYGSAGDGFIAVNLKDGELLWTKKDLKDANWILAGGSPLLQRKDGKLSRIRFTSEGIEEVFSLPTASARTWTPPSIIANVVYVRSPKELCAVQLAQK